MKRMLLTISYDGTAYHGWQVQPNGVSVQQIIQDSIEKMLGTRLSVTGCSRTDAGVHAKEFCFHTDCEDSLPESAFLKGLNSVLPSDIKVIDAKQVSNDFHARYDCLGKTYSYHFYFGRQDPFAERYSLFLDNIPSVPQMNVFCKKIIGKHDFAGFSSSGRTVEDTVRNVKECYVEASDSEMVLKITADGFLYNMVRIIAGTALAVGYGRLLPECADVIFSGKDRSAGGETLPAKALLLEKVYYKEGL